MQIVRSAGFTAVLFSVILSAGEGLRSESMADLAMRLKGETIGYLRELEPMMRNFGKVPEKDAEPKPQAEDNYFIDVWEDYKAAQHSYTVAQAYLFERNWLEAQTEFKRCQVMIEKLLEKLSGAYIDRAREIVRNAMQSMHPTEGKKGISMMQINVEYGPKSQKRKYFRVKRRASEGMESRFYGTVETHLARDMQRIENNINLVYGFIGDALELRRRAVTIEHHMETHQKIQSPQRAKRMVLYRNAIESARQAKRNALNVFALKYPYENYQHQLGKAADGKGDFPFYDSYYYHPAKLHPVYDERLPRAYRRDAADALGYVFNDEYKHKIVGAVWKEGAWVKCNPSGQDCKAVN